MTRVFIFLGPGGVGKTSTSIAWAYQKAKKGKKVGLLSIDPAKRLAQALGISLDSKTRIYEDKKGALIDALMIDQESVFQSMVFRHAKSEEDARKTMAHPLYRIASTKLAGSLEYMALAKLDEMTSQGDYDVIILDTPPDGHAIEFLCRPSLLGGFVEHKVLTWLIKPFHHASRFGLGQFFFAGEKLMGSLSKITGFQALKLVAEFLILMQQVIEGFYQSSERIKKILASPQTGFILVTLPQMARVQAALDLSAELASLGFSLQGLILNRCIPDELVPLLANIADEKILEVKDLKHRLLDEKKSISKILDCLTHKRADFFVYHIAESLRPIDSEEEIWKMAFLKTPYESTL